MLVLSRKAGETIQIDNVKVTVVRLDRNRVRIGIEAPPEMRIVRGELLSESTAVNDEGMVEPQAEPIAGGVA